VVVGEAESDPLPHAEVTNRNVRAIAYFLTVGSCHPPMSVAGMTGFSAPTEAILLPCNGCSWTLRISGIVVRPPGQV